jgi:NADPH-dependent 2,4-dienoyl-CoA reductase/sulfur reductase-like enzyme
MGERLVIIGADAAGMTAASVAKRRRRELEVIAFEKSAFASYAACGEPYYVSGDIPTLDKLIARTPEQFARAGIDLRHHHEVVAIDTDRQVVVVRNHADGTSSETGYDKLMYATGAVAAVPPIPGINRDGVHTLRTLDDADDLRSVATASRGRVVIVGGGYIGLEVAEAFHTRGWDVTVIEGLDALLPRTLDADLGAKVAEAAQTMGIKVRTGVMVDAIEGTDHVTSVDCAGEMIPADVVVVAVGSRPVVELAAEAGIPVGPTGAVAVDDHQRTGVEGIWAAGDCCEARHRVTGEIVNLHLATIANKAGRVAGFNMTGGDVAFPGTLGTAITRLHDLEVASTGARHADALAAGIDAVDTTVSGRTAAHYMPESSPITVRVTTERGSSRIVGAQIVGGAGSGKRIDVFATAIWEGMTAQGFEWVDLAYAPPFAGVWDISAIALRKAAEDALR